MKTVTTRDIVEVEYEVLPEEYKRKNTYGSNPVVKLILEEGATLKVPPDTRTYKLGRYLKEKGFSLKKRKIENGVIVWAEKISE